MSLALYLLAVAQAQAALAPTLPETAAPPALLVLGDADQDGLLDALALQPEREALFLRNLGDGSFIDLTHESGLAGIEQASFAAFHDLDRDGRPELLVLSAAFPARLFKNLDGLAFEDVSLDAGLALDEPALRAAFEDLDGDGLPDLVLGTAREDLLFKNLGQGRFEQLVLPLADARAPSYAPGATLARVDAETAGALERPSAGEASAGSASDGAALDGAHRLAPATTPRTARGASVSTALPGSVAGLDVAIDDPPGVESLGSGPEDLRFCTSALADQADPMNCLEASSVPLYGTLYPLGPELNIDGSGRVGIGTVSPLYRVHVVEPAGTGVFAQGGTTGVRGEANLVGTGNRYGGYFTSTGGSNNIGVFGTSSIAVYGVGTAYGVFGETNTSASTGVYGKTNHTSATTTGVLGEALSSAGTGVKGSHLATTGTAAGVEGRTSSATFLAPALRGVTDTSAAADVVAVEGLALPQPNYGRGGRFQGGRIGVEGSALLAGTGNRTGGFFVASGGDGEIVGVGGTATGSGTIVAGVAGSGLSDDALGVLGTAGIAGTTGIGVVGSWGLPIDSYAESGVTGSTASTIGVGVYGTTTTGEAGVLGIHDGTDGVAVKGTSQGSGGVGLWGETTGDSAIGVAGIARSTDGSGPAGVAGAHGGSLYVGGVGVSGVSSVADRHGVHGASVAATGQGVGVFGESDGAQGIGVKGVANAESGANVGVRGETLSPSGYGVEGVYSGSLLADTLGVHGSSVPGPNWGIGGWFSGGYIGVRGESVIAGSGARHGGYFRGDGGEGPIYAVFATASDPQADGEARAVYASCLSGHGYAGYFQGSVHVAGTLSKSAGAFRIDHPLDPANKTLTHSFVESPDMKNIYDGVAVLDDTGRASIELPEWFEALNQDFRYQLTSIGGRADLWIESEVKGNRFAIAGETPGMKVSWQVTGIRKDAYAEANRLVVEEWKRPKDRGGYLNPEAFGLAPEQGIEARRRAASETLKEARRGERVARPEDGERARREVPVTLPEPAGSASRRLVPAAATFPAAPPAQGAAPAIPSAGELPPRPARELGSATRPVPEGE